MKKLGYIQQGRKYIRVYKKLYMGEIDVRTERDKSLSDDENGKMYKDVHTFIQECGRFNLIIQI